MKRRMIVSLLLITSVALTGFVIHLPRINAAPQAPQVTVYNSNIALVKEIRTIDLKGGETTAVRITDVPALIDPTSLHFRSLTDPEHTAVVEQNFEYDLVNTLKILRKYVDREVRITTQDGNVYTGTLLSAQGDVVLKEKDGITILKQDQIEKFQLEDLPEGLITRPTLEWVVKAQKGGEHQVELAYLTEGMNWHANYVVHLGQDEKHLDLNGWITLDNRSGKTYKQATLKLVAGDIARVRKPRAYRAPEEKTLMPTPETEEAAVEERKFFEYHLYQVKEPVTIRNNQTKQIEFITASDVPAKKEYILRLFPMGYQGGVLAEPEISTKVKGNPDIFISFQTGPDQALNQPLPAGVVRLYKEDVDGAPLLIGEARIAHTPVGETVRLRVGRAFDVVGERVQTDFTKLGPRALEESYKITVRNHKEEPVNVRVVENLFRAAEWEIVKASHDYTQGDAHTIYFDVSVPADGEEVITYTVRYRW